MKKVVKSKNITINDLGKKIHVLIKAVDSLAVSVAKGFDGVDKRFNGIEKNITKLKKDTIEVKDSLKATRRDVLNIGDRFVPRFEFDNLLIRVGKLEQKTKSKNREY